MENTTRNFHAHGGNEWIIGGKLTFLPGAVVEGAEGLFDLPAASGAVIPCVQACEATTVVALRESFNQLLATLKAAGFMASDMRSQPSDTQNQPSE